LAQESLDRLKITLVEDGQSNVANVGTFAPDPERALNDYGFEVEGYDKLVARPPEELQETINILCYSLQWI
jgi:hypothetical protein